MAQGLRICLIRHGETEWSLSGRHTGSTALPLTAQGIVQARTLAPCLAHTVFARVLVSPYLRARQTCALADCAAASEEEPDLEEWHYGDYEGLRSEDIGKIHPGWDVWRDGCPHGETPAQVSARADRLIKRLCELRGAVALFSHGQFGAALAARWIGLPVREGQHFMLHPASLSVLGRDETHFGRRVIMLWNECPYLSGSPARR